MDWSMLPDTFYRVSAKALVFDDQQRLLVFKDKDDMWEMPGGGWESSESFAECITRELGEEVKATVQSVGSVQFTYRSVHEKGFYKLCIAAPVTIASTPLVPTDDNLVEAKYVTRDEFITLSFQGNEAGVLQEVDKIWPVS